MSESVETSTEMLEGVTLGLVVEVVIQSAFSPMVGKGRDERPERDLKEVIDLAVPIECRCCSSGGGHSVKGGSRRLLSF